MADYIPHANKLLDSYTLTYKGEVFSSTFGQMYRQVAPNGIDNLTYTSAFSMGNLSETMRQDILTFLRSIGSAISFLIPRVNESDLRVLLIPGSYSEVVSRIGTYSITFKVVESKELGVS
jgi:phage-related protein